MDLATLGIIVVIAGLIVLAIVLAIIYVKIYNEICQPNEVLVFSGARPCVIHSGSKIRIPMLQVVDRIDITNMIIEINVVNAYSKGGIPLNIKGVANVKIGSHRPYIDNAIERFLGVKRKVIERVAKETLEGNMRGVLARLTPEEINNDRVKFAESLLEEAGEDLRRLGMVLDNLKIQSVSDDRKYLDSIGRKQSAELLMRSRVVEAENQAISSAWEAENRLRTELAQIAAQREIAKIDAERRIVDAQTKGEAMAAEERSAAVSAIARATAGLDVQRARIEQIQRQLQADVVEQARARKEKLQAEAVANAAKTIEDGRATVQALQALIHTWRKAGDSARQVFLTQQFEVLVDRMMATVGELNIDKITVIDSKIKHLDDNASIPMKAVSATSQIKETLGIDIPEIVNRVTQSK